MAEIIHKFHVSILFFSKNRGPLKTSQNVVNKKSSGHRQSQADQFGNCRNEFHQMLEVDFDMHAEFVRQILDLGISRTPYVCISLEMPPDGDSLSVGLK